MTTKAPSLQHTKHALYRAQIASSRASSEGVGMAAQERVCCGAKLAPIKLAELLIGTVDAKNKPTELTTDTEQLNCRQQTNPTLTNPFQTKFIQYIIVSDIRERSHARHSWAV